MQPRVLPVLCLLGLTALMLPHAAATSTVTFQLKAGSHLNPTTLVECTVSVTTPADGADILDAAVSSGCISDWDSQNFGTSSDPDRFVTCINGLCGEPGTSWWFYINDAMAAGGVDHPDLAPVGSGDTVTFVYADWESPCVELSDPCGLVP